MSCPLCHSLTYLHLGLKNNYDLIKCGNCRFVYVGNLSDSKFLSSQYDGYKETEKYQKKLRKKIFTSKFKLRRTRRFLGSSQKQFLDVGCNLGATVYAAYKLGFDAMGIDLDEKTLVKSRTLFPNCEFQGVSTQDLCNKGRRFDLIYCAEVIEHVADPHTFMKSLVDLLNPYGLIYLTTPDTGHRKVSKDFLSWKEVKPPEHISYFNKENMSYLLEHHGMQILKVYWNHRANLRVIAKKISQ